MTAPAVPMSDSAPAGRLVGVDIGGSKTHVVVAAADGRVLDDFRLGGANIAAVGAGEVGRRVDAVVARIGLEGVAAVAVGAAGLDSPEQQRDLEALLAARIPGLPMMVVRDSALLLAAAGVRSGVAAIAGTGSVVWGRAVDGRTAQAGGWGYLLGDEGSGYAIARSGIRHLLSLHDSGSRPDALARAILDHCGDADPPALLGHFYAEPDRRYWATVSAVVSRSADAGDAPAGAILDEAAEGLVAAIRSVTTRLGEDLPVVMAGGVVSHQPAMRQRIVALLSDHADVRVLPTDPVVGALELARGLIARRPTGTPRSP